MTELSEDVRRARERQADLARARFAETKRARAENEALRKTDGTGVHDDIDRLEARAERLLASNEAPAEAVVRLGAAPASGRRLALERIIALSNELQSWTFLPRGARAAGTVARISTVDNGRMLPLGTGFMVSPRLLMTNNHVLPSVEAARQVVLEFSAELDIDNQAQVSVRYELDPGGFFATDEHLDVTVVLVAGAEGGTPGERFGWNHLVRATGKIVTGEAVNVIGHPSGRLKEIAIRSNRLELVLPDFIQYSTDTEPGNSGSPVYNDQWEVVALHHAGVPKTDGQGRVLRTDGSLAQDGDDDDKIAWVANEGARISRIIDFLAQLRLNGAQAASLGELGPAAEILPSGGVPAPREIGTTPQPESVGTSPVGRPGRKGAGVHLVFLHGRNQQGKDPRRLRVDWTAGLNSGLTRAELPLLDPATAWFPFYGDRLVKALGEKESAVRAAEAFVNPAEALAPPAGDPARRVYEQLIAQAAARAGMPEELAATEGFGADEGFGSFGAGVVGRLQRQLDWIAKRTGLDDAIIALVFADVAAYLGRPAVRQAVLDAVADCWPAKGPVVLVSHSLGTVVAMDVLHSLGEVDIPLLVTAGSPLGMDTVYDRLLAGGVHQPKVDAWINAWCRPDAVAIGCPLRPTWGPQVSDIVTDNPQDRAHSIAEYLGDTRVAQRIGTVLAQTSATPRTQ